MFASRRDADAILARFPGPVTVAISRAKWLAVLAGGAAFVAIFVWMLRADPDDVSAPERWTAWAGLLFFGLVMLVAAVALLPGAGSLTLDADGFETCSLFRRFRTPWRQVSEFQVGAYTTPGRLQRTVIYDDAKPASLFAHSVRQMFGRNSALPDTYGLSHEELARLMTQWRTRALDR